MNQLQYERERLAFGDQLRTLRKSKDFTGTQLAKRTGISQSKLSKIETGALIPSTEDLKHLFDLLEPPRDHAKNLTESAQALRTEFISWRFGHRKGLGAKQIEVAQIESRSRRIRSFQLAAVPGLLQTAEYARRTLNLSNVTDQPDVEAAVGLRMQRQNILYESGRQFEFLIMESAALSRFCDPSIVTRQLNKIRFLFELPNIKIGFVSNRMKLSCIPASSFVVFDSSTAIVETLTGEVSTLDERDVATYNAAFDEFASVGAFGADAECFLDECMRLLNNLQPNPARPAADEIHSHAR